MDFITFQNNYQKRKVIEVPNQVPHQPLVSILVQTYQHEHYIKECIQGILAQKTNFTFEILIGEDDSRDRTREICLELAKKYPNKIRLFLHHRENQKKILGESTANFNAFYNFYSSRGKYCAFCEGDDYWTDPNKLQIQIDFLLGNPQYVLTYHPYITVNTLGIQILSEEETFQPKKDIEQDELLAGIYHPLLLTICFKKDFLEIPKEMIEVINIDTFLLSFLGTFGKAKYLGNIFPSMYRKHSGGIWSNRIREKKILSKIITFSNLEQYYFRINNKVLYNIYKEKHLSHYKMLLMRYLKKGSLNQIFPLLIKYFTIRKKRLLN